MDLYASLDSYSDVLKSQYHPGEDAHPSERDFVVTLAFLAE